MGGPRPAGRRPRGQQQSGEHEPSGSTWQSSQHPMMILPSSSTLVDEHTMNAYIDVCQYMREDSLMATLELLPLRDLQACCAPITREVISEENAVSVARAMKALADPARLRLISMVAAHEDGEACVCDLTEPLGLSQPTVSHHLKILVEAGYLSRSKRGTWAYYRIVPGSLDAVSSFLTSV
jgi:ArsR family transcriptional regulator